MNAATDLLDGGGPAAVTFRAVGQAAGFSHNAAYKQFGSKEELLAAIATRELDRLAAEATPESSARDMVFCYVRWALAFPARFKLTMGSWLGVSSPELRQAAIHWKHLFHAAIARDQGLGLLPPGDTERVGSLVLALAHGATDLQLAGHLSAQGKGKADATDLVDDLFRFLVDPRPS